MQDGQPYLEPWHSQNILFKHFQGYLGIFRDIDVYSAKLRDAQITRSGRPSLPFLKNQESVLILEKRLCLSPDLVKFSIQNVVLRVF